MLIDLIMLATKLEHSLEITWKGMLVIFFAIGIIFGATKLLNKIFKK